MGNLTFTPIEGVGQGPAYITFGNRQGVFGTLTFSSSYATGGDSITPASLGLDQVDFIVVTPAVIATTFAHALMASVSQVNAFPVGPSTATIKIQAFETASAGSNPMDEVANATNLSSYTFYVWAIGA